uniref:Fibronectin type-III domain-containing protein n=1 Tax=Mesocestoides corti TaxID=53468 RepID=A0A5K3FS07_MESCO
MGISRVHLGFALWILLLVTPEYAINVPNAPTWIESGATTLKWKFTKLDDQGVTYSYKLVDDMNLPFGSCNVNTLTCEATGLSPATAYTVCLVACSSSGGNTVCSEKSAPQTSSTSPRPPARVTVVSQSTTSLKINIRPPENNLRINRYVAEIQGNNQLKCTATGGTLPSCVIEGLSLSTKYVVEVRAWLGDPFSQVSSDVKTGTGWTMLEAPKDVTVIPLSTTSVKVTLTPPDDTKNINRYEVTAKGMDPPVKCDIEVGQSPLECELKGFAAGTQYTFEVQSRMETVVVGSAIVKATGWTKPNAPESVTVTTKTSSSLSVAVVAPNDASGIGRYEAFVEGDPSKACTMTSLDKPECQLEGLEAGTEYSVNVEACVNDTDPPVCSESKVGSGWTKPNAPTSVAVTPDTTSSIMVEFEAPSDAKGITNYDVSLVGADPPKYCSVASSHKLDCKFEGLEPSTEYQVSVTSCIAREVLFACSEDVVASGWTKPNSPRNLSIGDVFANSVVVRWLQPSGRTENIKFYQALARQKTEKAVPADEYMCSVDASAEVLECSINGLSANTDYTISVRSCISDTVCGDDIGFASITTTNEPEEVPEYVIIIVAVIIAIVILTIIIVIIVNCQKRDKTKDADTDEKGRLVTKAQRTNSYQSSASDLKTILSVEK